MCKNYRAQKGSKYGCGQKPALTQKARNGGFCNSVFTNKDDPDYLPSYGNTYTDRQKRIRIGSEVLPWTQTFRMTFCVIKKEGGIKNA